MFQKKIVLEKVNINLIVEVAMTLFINKGYSKTSMKDIAETCGIKKATLYYHIRSREELLFRVLDYWKTRFEQVISVVNENKDKTNRQCLQLIANKTYEFFVGFGGQCLTSNLCVEVSGELPEILILAKDSFKKWLVCVSQLLVDTYGKKRARECTQDCFCQIQGALLLGRILGSSTPLKRAIKQLSNLL